MLKKLYVHLPLMIMATLISNVAAEDYIDLVKKGNQAFKNQEYQKALEHYRNAETGLPESPELNYNIAGTLFKEGKYEEAVELFGEGLNAIDINDEANSHYNLGSTYFRMGDFQNAISSYQKALEINPDDLDAKFNLELARKRLKEQIQPQQQDQDQQQQQEQQQQEQKDQDQEKQEQDQQQQNEDEQQKQQPDQKPQDQQKQPKEMSKEDAERILNALKDEQDLQKRIKRQTTGGNYSGKDW